MNREVLNNCKCSLIMDCQVYNKCCYICGLNNPEERKTTSFFKFPDASDVIRREAWMKFAKIGNEVDTSNLYLCHNHFVSHDVTRIRGKLKLRENAVPMTTREELYPVDNTLSGPNPCTLCKSSALDGMQTFHPFPKDKSLRKKWADFCGIPLSKISDENCLCQLHFKEDDFIVKPLLHNKTIFFLKPTTIPSFKTQFGSSEKKSAFSPSCMICGYKEQDIFYHKFPTNPSLKKQWLNICNLEENADCSALRVCGKHFRENDFQNGDRCLLKKDVIPSLISDTIDDFTEYQPNVHIEEISKSEFTQPEISIPAEVIFNEHNYDAITEDKLNFSAARLKPIDNAFLKQKTFRRQIYFAPHRPVRYVGDLKPSDIKTPQQAQGCFELVKKKIAEKEKKIRMYNERNKRLLKRISALEEYILSHLEESLMIDDKESI